MNRDFQFFFSYFSNYCGIANRSILINKILNKQSGQVIIKRSVSKQEDNFARVGEIQTS
jgi:hypothetical protein